MSVMQSNESVTASDQDLRTIIEAYSDVTNRLEHSHGLLAREVCRLRAQLAEKDLLIERSERLAALGEMAAGVAHEIRNPLGGIGLFAALLERDLVDRPAEKVVAGRIRQAVRNLERIVADTLSFARGAEPVSRTILMAEVVEHLKAQVQPAASARNVTLVWDESLQHGCCVADGAQVERAIMNLVFNAIEATQAGGRVVVRYEKLVADVASQPRGHVDSMAVICIEDEGCGVPEELQQKIFHPFFTTKDEGTGLGLAIAHRIAEANGGYVRVKNREGGGARFMLALPMEKSPLGCPVNEGEREDGGVMQRDVGRAMKRQSSKDGKDAVIR